MSSIHNLTNQALVWITTAVMKEQNTSNEIWFPGKPTITLHFHETRTGPSDLLSKGSYSERMVHQLENERDRHNCVEIQGQREGQPLSWLHCFPAELLFEALPLISDVDKPASISRRHTASEGEVHLIINSKSCATQTFSSIVPALKNL